MAWSIDAITIHVDKDSGGREPLYGEHDVLDATSTVLHFFGARSKTRHISGMVQSESSLSSLDTKAKTDADVTLTSDQGSQGTFRITSLQYERRQALGEANTWYYVTLELRAT